MASNPAPLSRRSRWLRWLKRCLLACVAVLVAGILWLFLSLDEPPPDVSDFIVVPLKLPDDQNAYALLVKAATLVKPNFAGDNHERLAEMATGKNWDDVFFLK